MTKKSGRKTNKVGRRPKGVKDSERKPFVGIGGLFAGRAVVALLKLFILDPTRDFYQRELVDLARERLFLIQRGLARLVQAGIVELATRGNRVYYRANRSHPAFEDLKAVILKTVGVGDVLRTQLAGVRDRVRIAFVYGSVARGEETVSSDIDIMLIGTLSGREVASALAPVKRMLKREINPLVYSPAELRKRAKEHQPFVTSVLKEPKLFLVGDERALKAVLDGRSA